MIYKMEDITKAYRVERTKRGYEIKVSKKSSTDTVYVNFKEVA